MDKLPAPRNFVDDLVFKKLQAVGMPPSDLCDDATFIRRVTVDVAGRLPTPEELATFLAASGAAPAGLADDRRRIARVALIDRLLESPDYAEYFANKWSSLLRNKRNDAKFTRGTYAFFNWISESFIENKPYDQFVREIIASSDEVAEHTAVAW